MPTTLMSIKNKRCCDRCGPFFLATIVARARARGVDGCREEMFDSFFEYISEQASFPVDRVSFCSPLYFFT